MTDMTAGGGTPELEFSAPSARTLRKVLEIGGWLMMAVLIFTGLTAIFGRGDFLDRSRAPRNSPILLSSLIPSMGAMCSSPPPAGRT
jgi:hypothetical protein